MGLGNISNIIKLFPHQNQQKVEYGRLLRVMRVPFLRLLIPSILPLNVLEDVCLRYIIFPQPASNFNQRKMRLCVRYPFFGETSIKNWRFFANAFHAWCSSGRWCASKFSKHQIWCSWVHIFYALRAFKGVTLNSSQILAGEEGEQEEGEGTETFPSLFLVAWDRLYKLFSQFICLSVRPSVRPSVCPSVPLLVPSSVCKYNRI